MTSLLHAAQVDKRLAASGEALVELQATPGGELHAALAFIGPELNDLLGGKQNCPLRETPKGIMVEGLGHEVVTSVAEVMAALQRGSDKRMVGAARSKPPSTQA